MARPGHVYHWKHGWIPLDHTAALSKAKGNPTLAAKMLNDAHGLDAGINTRADVEGAARSIPSAAARTHLEAAARNLGAADLIPAKRRSETNWGWERLPNTTDSASSMPTKDVVPHAFDWVRDGTLFDKSNPHQHDSMMGLMDSMESEGVKTPIVLGHDHLTGKTQVLDGNHRLAAAMALGMTHVPVVWWGDPPKGRHSK